MSKSTAISIDGGQTVEDAFERVLHSNLTGARAWEPVALAGDDIEGVHQMRVCIRRMRSALTVFREAIPRKVTASFAKEMRWAAQALDRARDLDVYITENLSSKGKKQQKKLSKIARKHRKNAYRQVERFIQGRRYARLCGEFSDWLEARRWREKLSDEQRKGLEESITPYASRVLEAHRTRILEDGSNIEELDSDALHQLRIDCKKLRYATEFFAPLYSSRMKTFTAHLKGLQDLLGTLHDTSVMTGLQKDLLKGKKDKNLARYTHKLERQRHKEALSLIKETRIRWQSFSRAERPWLSANAA